MHFCNTACVHIMTQVNSADRETVVLPDCAAAFAAINAASENTAMAAQNVASDDVTIVPSDFLLLTKVRGRLVPRF